MFYKAALWTNALLIFCVFTASAMTGRPHPIKVNARFLATSTSIRSSWSTSQDVYLIEMVPHGSDQPVLARLIDDHPEYHEMFLAKRFASTDDATLRIWRDQSCDIAFAQMPLRTPPGDPRAVLPERLGFQPKLSRAVEADEILPCYRMMK